MARRSSFRGRGHFVKRQTGWEEGVGELTSLQAVTASTSLIIGSVGFQLAVDGVTLIRTRGIIQVILTAAGAAEGFNGAFGICVVSNDAFAVGITAIPNPVDDMDWDGWLYHQFWSLMAPAAFQATGTGPFVKDLVIDSKAMRKVGQNDTIVLVGQFLEIGTAALSVTAGSRFLFKLS